MILTNWVHWTVKSHKIIHVSLYQIINDGTVLVLYWYCTDGYQLIKSLGEVTGRDYSLTVTSRMN